MVFDVLLCVGLDVCVFICVLFSCLTGMLFEYDVGVLCCYLASVVYYLAIFVFGVFIVLMIGCVMLLLFHYVSIWVIIGWSVGCWLCDVCWFLVVCWLVGCTFVIYSVLSWLSSVLLLIVAVSCCVFMLLFSCVFLWCLACCCPSIRFYFFVCMLPNWFAI